MTHDLSADTQAALLLTSQLAQREQGPSPLRTTEFVGLVKVLKENGLQPSDLFEAANAERMDEVGGIDAGRVRALLARGLALSMALDKWESQGIWVLGWTDEPYPERYRERLRGNAPPVLYGIGDPGLLSGRSVGIVGSRNIDERGVAFARGVAESCARQKVKVISGGARGVDSEAMIACVTTGGSSVGILSDSLARQAVSKFREGVVEGTLVLISPFEPEAHFLIGNAMARNKLIYALSDFALVVSSDYNTGGTWAGATENLKKGWAPLFVRSGDDVPEGNRRLLKMGAIPMPEDFSDLGDPFEWMEEQSVPVSQKDEEGRETLSLF
ncbi:MAG: DNA-processing protein DprA [Armatimonadota bacterium]|nr:DNA-processing protein DprA [Armatimonadota bacterium]